MSHGLSLSISPLSHLINKQEKKKIFIILYLLSQYWPKLNDTLSTDFMKLLIEWEL